MKKLTISLCVLLIALSLRAQGVVHFTNRSIAPIVDAPIIEPSGGGLAPAGSLYVQLHAGLERDSLTPVGVPITIGIGPDHTYPGYYDGGMLVLPGIPAGGVAWVQVWAWDSVANGYADAAGTGLRHGRSNLFSMDVRAPGETVFPLIGLEPMVLEIPEPPPTALAMAGLALLWLGSRRRGRR